METGREKEESQTFKNTSICTCTVMEIYRYAFIVGKLRLEYMLWSIGNSNFRAGLYSYSRNKSQVKPS